MPLTQGNTAITMLRVENVASLNFSQQALAACALPPFQGEEKVMGLVPLNDPYDAAWKNHHAFGEYAAFALRIDRKSVPGAVLKKHYDKALAGELAKSGAEGKGVGKQRKKELKEQIKAGLLSKAEAVPAFYEIAVNIRTGLVYVASNSNAVIQLAREYIAKFGSEPKEIFDQEEGDNLESVMAFMREIVLNGIKGKEADIYPCGKITIADPDTKISAQSRSDSEIKEILTAIQEGKSVSDTGVKIVPNDDSEPATCAISGGFRLSGLKLPKTEPGKDGEMGFEGMFLERMFLVEKYTRLLVDAFEGWKKTR